MLLTIGMLGTVAAAVVIYRVRWPRRMQEADLGWMSAQWLAEYRASHWS